MGERGTSQGGDERPLKGAEKRLLALLGLPTFGLALSIGTVTTYVPLLARQFTSSTAVIGFVIAAEGLVALVVPIAAGAWSDQLRTRFGGRLPFLALGAPAVGVAVALMAFMTSLGPLALVVFLFFIAYYAAYEPYRALYPDLLTAEVAGRGQSSQAIFRGMATGAALVGGGLLFGISPKLPFLIFALLAFGTIAEFVWGIAGSKAAQQQEEHEARSARDTVRRIVGLLRERPALRAFLVANALWELSLAALKTFIMLFLTVGVGLGMSSAAGAIAIVLVLILIAAPVSGKLGDRFGKTRLVGVALWLYGIGLLVPFFTQSPYLVLPILPFVAFGGGMILTLPYAILMPLMPEEEHGLITGFYSFSRGLGILLGPALAGLAITALRSSLPATDGYSAMFLVCGAAILASIAFMGPLQAKEAELRRERASESGAEDRGSRRSRVGSTAEQTA
jgi:MFS family permease